MKENLDLIRFNVLRNALYHVARRRSLERINRFFNFMVIVLGTAAVADLITVFDLRVPPEAIGAAIAIVGALQLVFDFGRAARDHQALQREYYHLLADIEGVIAPSEDQLAEWYSRMIRITADETPALKAIDSKAYNDTIDAMEWDRDQRLVIPWWHKPFAGFVSFEGFEYPKAIEIKERKARRKATQAR
ncbi:hypothetical protein [Marivita sp.]|uniref:hypothetical protein n=1 Tax=Marivita sp. TaxID=2003365 RepID=UPI003F701926